jgi:hypothetical protein
MQLQENTNSLLSQKPKSGQHGFAAIPADNNHSAFVLY